MTSQRQQKPIDLAPLFDALEPTLGIIEDPQRREYHQRLLANARPQQEKAALGILTSVLDALNESSGTRATVQLQGDGYVLNIDREGAEPEPVFDAGDEVERVTLRLPKKLKDAIDTIAERSGQSTNTWYVRTLSRSLAHQLRGFGFGGDAGAQGGEAPWGWRGRGRRRGGPGRGTGAGGVD